MGEETYSRREVYDNSRNVRSLSPRDPDFLWAVTSPEFRQSFDEAEHMRQERLDFKIED